jgi:hypothetical protein
MSFSTTDPKDVYDDNYAALMSILYGNTYRQNNSGLDYIKIADESIEIQVYPMSAFTPTTTSTNYIPAKLIASTYGSSDKTLLFSYSPYKFGTDNTRLLHRLTKYVYKYSTSISDKVAAVTYSVLQYLYATYLTPNSYNRYNLSNDVDVYKLYKNPDIYDNDQTNDPTTVVSLDTAIDALLSLGTTFSATADPRLFFLPTTSYSYNDSSLAAYPNNSGLISYMDLFHLRTGSYSDPTNGNVYPFFNSASGTQKHGLGYLYFLTTQEGLHYHEVFSAYLGKDQPSTSKYADYNVYDSSSHTTTHNIVADIDQTYWAIANLGTTGNFPILMCVLIDGVNYTGGNGPYPNDPTGALSARPTTSFDIYTCCDNGWGFGDSTPTNNGFNMTAEMLSYQMVNAALTKNYSTFCALHRMYYFMLYTQNGRVGDANSPTVDVSPINLTQNKSTNRYQNKMAYTSYCMGFQPYLNFYGKVSTSQPDATTKPIYYCRNPYYKTGTNSDQSPNFNILSSATDADFNICFAYKLASIASTLDLGFAAYDTLSASTATAVGASSSITWDYMYNQIKTTILSQTGSFTGSGVYSNGSTFYKGAILTDKYITMESHDSNQYNNTLHPDYIDLALFNDWVVESAAADVTGYAAKGSLVLTSNGYTLVENISQQDKVVFQGRRMLQAPVRRVDCITKYNITVVRIKRNAFGKNRPFRTLLLPINNVLFENNRHVVVNTLVNNRSIRRVFFEKLVLYRVVTPRRFINLNGMVFMN